MTYRAQGRKKSLFIAKSTVEDGAFFDYVVNGSNFKIPYTDFLSGLGVTGTIVQAGAVTGAPVLDTDGSVNKIRNIENGSGVSANVSAGNGIVLTHTFTADATGIPLLLNTTATNPVVASLVSGTGISLTATGNYVTVSASEASVAFAKVTMQGNTTDTVIASTAIPVLVAGTFVSDNESGFTGNAAGRITYNGSDTRRITIHAILSLTVATGTYRDMSIYIALNGVVRADTKVTATTSASYYRNLCSYANIEMSTNDYVEMFIQNETSTDNLEVLSAIFGAEA